MRLSDVPDLGPPDLGLTAHNKAKPPRATGSGPPKATLKPLKERTQPSGTPTLLADYRRRLQKAFKMTGDPVDRHYGLHIKRGSTGEVYADCMDYILETCKELAIPAGNKATPMDATASLPKCDGPCLDPELQSRYRSLVGSRMYCATTCRPDVAYYIGASSRHLVHPQRIHIKAAERAFQYLRSTADLALCYGRVRSQTRPLWVLRRRTCHPGLPKRLRLALLLLGRIRLVEGRIPEIDFAL